MTAPPIEIKSQVTKSPAKTVELVRDSISTKKTMPTCKKCGQKHWPFRLCAGKKKNETDKGKEQAVSRIIIKTIPFPDEKFTPTCEKCGKKHWPLDPSCIGKKGAKAEARAKARAEAEKKIRAKAEAKARAKAEKKAKVEAEARAKAEGKARVEAELKAKAEEKARTEAELRAKAEEKARVEAEARAKAKAERKAKVRAEKSARAEAKVRAKARVESEYEARGTSDDNRPSSIVYHPSSLQAICAKDIMQKNVVWGSSDDSVQQALAKMQQHDAGYMMVGRNGVSEGIVSRYDLAGAISPYLRPVFARWRRPSDDATLQIKIKWIMTRPVLTINPETPLPAIMQKMRRFSVRCLPVMNHRGKVQGLITTFDIFKALLKLKSNANISTADKALQGPHSYKPLSAASVMHREYITPAVPTPSPF